MRGAEPEARPRAADVISTDYRSFQRISWLTYRISRRLFSLPVIEHRIYNFNVVDDSSTVGSFHRVTNTRTNTRFENSRLHRGRRRAMSEQLRGYAWDDRTASKLGHRCRRSCMG